MGVGRADERIAQFQPWSIQWLADYLGKRPTYGPWPFRRRFRVARALFHNLGVD